MNNLSLIDTHILSQAQGIKTKQASQRKFTSDCKFEQSDYLGVRVWTDPDGPYDV